MTCIYIDSARNSVHFVLKNLPSWIICSIFTGSQTLAILILSLAYTTAKKYEIWQQLCEDYAFKLSTRTSLKACDA